MIELFFGVEAFALMTNRIVAGLLRDGRLSLRKAMTKRGFLLLFHGRGSTTDSTRRMEMKKHEKLDAFWDLRVKLLAKPCACSDVEERVVDILTGAVEAVAGFARNPWKLRTNGQFKHLFPSWLLQQVFPG